MSWPPRWSDASTDSESEAIRDNTPVARSLSDPLLAIDVGVQTRLTDGSPQWTDCLFVRLRTSSASYCVYDSLAACSGTSLQRLLEMCPDASPHLTWYHCLSCVVQCERYAYKGVVFVSLPSGGIVHVTPEGYATNISTEHLHRLLLQRQSPRVISILQTSIGCMQCYPTEVFSPRLNKWKTLPWTSSNPQRAVVSICVYVDILEDSILS